jgi:hypothetical protein
MRTTDKAVQEILGDNYDSINEPSLFPYIRAASLIVDDVVTCLATKGLTYTTARLREIETWVAAYLYTITDPIYKSKTTANSSATYPDRSYLDAAKALDNSGCLSGALSGNRASLDWLGLPPSSQTDYINRR